MTFPKTEYEPPPDYEATVPEGFERARPTKNMVLSSDLFIQRTITASWGIPEPLPKYMVGHLARDALTGSTSCWRLLRRTEKVET